MFKFLQFFTVVVKNKSFCKRKVDGIVNISPDHIYFYFQKNMDIKIGINLEFY